MNVLVIGGAGFVAGELLRILLGHPDVTALAATSRSRAGARIGDVHPALAPLTDAVLSGETPGRAAAGRDVVFLALEHGESSRVVPEVVAAGPRLVVDLAADFRLADPALHERWYGPRAPAPVEFTYALADVAGERLAGARALAVPGCFATAAQLALWPLAAWADGDPPVLFAVTGSSGGGARPRATAHHPARASNLWAYAPFAHRHEAEIAERWEEWAGPAAPKPRLLVHAGPFVRGIHLTLHARVPDAAGAAGAYAEAYAGRPFLRVLDAPPELAHVVGTNEARLHAFPHPEGGEIQVTVAIDNLLKGAAGQAVQAMNLALGLPETAGLVLAGAYPC
ncbi:MAG TPA: N-acetyl-gamma-glutamyl-phosphate reductase [Gemmatimonadota bacterium]|nr:N-acetyl-gamma-glutamyl-phosphate reductase [Gemmatimonadota bacterium]